MDGTTFRALLLVVLTAATPALADTQGAKSDSRVETLLQGAALAYSVDEDGDFRLIYELPDGRSQLVWVASRTARLQTVEVRDVWSVAYRSVGQVSPDIANQLLLDNAGQALGAWQIQRSGDEYLIVFSVPIPAESSGATLLETLDTVIRVADGLERRLTGDDRF